MERTLEIPFGDVRKILIRSANWVGDAVMSLPAMASVRQGFPGVEISLLAKPRVAEIYRENPLVDRVILYRDPGIHHGWGGIWQLARQIREEKFDLAILLQNAFEAALISFLARIPQRAGYRTDGRGILLTHAVAVNGEVKKGHQVDYYLELMRRLGLQPTQRVPILEVAEGWKKESERILKKMGWEGSDRLVGISPGATYGSAKEWFPERYGELSERMVKDFGAHIFIFGSEEDEKVAAKMKEAARVPLMDLTGKTTLGQAIALISKCRLFITNDSGLMHVAAALGVPLVAIFGSTDPRRTGPLGTVSRVIHKAIPCAPCFQKRCPEDRKCMDLISVEEVYEEVKKFWRA